MLQDALGGVYYHAPHDDGLHQGFALTAYSHTECITTVPLIDLLVQSGAYVNAHVNEPNMSFNGDSERSPVFRLVQYGCIEGIRRLVEVYGSDVNKHRYARGWGAAHPMSHDTALDDACNQWFCDPSSRRAQLISALLQLGANADDALHMAVTRCQASLVKLLVDTLLTCDSAQLAQALAGKDAEDRSLLHWAVSTRFIPGVTHLLEVSSKLGLVPTLLTQQDSSGTDVVTLVKRMQGDNLIQLFEPYCPKVC
jgi:hypothetical protein